MAKSKSNIWRPRVMSEAQKAAMKAGREKRTASLLARKNASGSDAGLNKEVVRAREEAPANVLGPAELRSDDKPWPGAARPKAPEPKHRAKRGKRKAMPVPDADDPVSKKTNDRDAKKIMEMARQLKGGHELATMFTGIQSFQISDQQAVMLADPAYRVCKKYGISLDMVVGPEVTLITMMAMVYGPMLRMVKAEVELKRQEEARSAHPDTERGQVVYPPQFNGAAPPGGEGPSPIVFDVSAGGDGPPVAGGSTGSGVGAE